MIIKRWRDNKEVVILNKGQGLNTKNGKPFDTICVGRRKGGTHTMYKIQQFSNIDNGIPLYYYYQIDEEQFLSQYGEQLLILVKETFL